MATTAFVIGQGSDTNPLSDGTAAQGTSKKYSRQDHVHPSDTSREASLSNPATDGMFLTSTSAGVRSWSTVTPDYYSSEAITTGLTLTAAWGKLYTIDASSNGVDITLPSSSGNTGKFIRVRRIDTGTNSVVIHANGAENLLGIQATAVALSIKAGGSVLFRSDGTGPVVEDFSNLNAVFREWLPSDYGANLRLWLIPDSLSAGSLSTWNDSSGVGNNFSQGTSSYRPTVTASAINGYPSVTFDGSDDYMSSAAAATNAANTIFALVKPSSTAATNNGVIAAANQSSGFGYAFNGLSSDFKQRFYQTNVAWWTESTSALTSNDWNITAGFWNQSGGAGGYYNNGSANGTFTQSATLSGSGTYNLGAGLTSAEHRLKADLAEVVYFKAVLTSGDIDKVSAYLAYKYNLVSKLPSGHTYKTNRPLQAIAGY